MQETIPQNYATNCKTRYGKLSSGLALENYFFSLVIPLSGTPVEKSYVDGQSLVGPPFL